MKIFVIFTALIILLCLLTSKKVEFSLFDKFETGGLKGIGALLVLWGHVGDRLGVGNIQFIAGAGVSVFLIFSGFGIEKSFQINKFTKYWRKHLFAVLIPYWIVNIWNMLLNEGFEIFTYLKRALLVDRDFHWYIRYILICYFIYWLVRLLQRFFLFSENLFLTLLWTAFGIYFIVETLFTFNPEMPFLRARQMSAFPLGVTLSKKMPFFTNLLSKNFRKIVLLLSSLFIGISCMGITQIPCLKENIVVGNIISLFSVVPLAIALIMFCRFTRIFISNRFVQICGKASLEIYLVQFSFLHFNNGSIKGTAIFIALLSLCTLAQYFVDRFLINQIKK